MTEYKEKTKNLCAQIPESLHARVRSHSQNALNTTGNFSSALEAAFYGENAKSE